MAIIVESNKPPIKEVIDTRRQEQSVLAVEPFFVRRVTPRLAVACDEVDRVIDARNPTVRLNPAHSIPKEPLPSSCLDDGKPVSLWNRSVVCYTPLEFLLPDVEVVRHYRLDLAPCREDCRRLLTNQAD